MGGGRLKSMQIEGTFFTNKGAYLNEQCTFIFIYWRRLLEWRINGDSKNLHTIFQFRAPLWMEKSTFIFIYWRRLFEWRINGDLQNLNLLLFTEGACLNGELMEILWQSPFLFWQKAPLWMEIVPSFLFYGGASMKALWMELVPMGHKLFNTFLRLQIKKSIDG